MFSRIKNSNRNLIDYVKSLSQFKSKNLGVTLSLMVLVGLTEGISLLLLVPLLQLVGLDIQQGALGQVAGFIASFFAYLGVTPTLGVVLLIYVFVISLNALLYRLQMVKTSQIEYDYAAHLRKDLFSAITGSNWLFFTGKRSSDFAHALTYEIERISTGTSFFLSLIASCIVLLVYVVFALKISGIVTGLIIIVGLILLLVLKRRTQSAGKSGENLSSASKDLYSSTLKQMDGMKTIKSFSMEEKNIELFNLETEGVKESYMDAIRSYADVRFFFSVGSVIILSLLVFILIEVMATPTAELLLLLYLFVRMIPRFSNIQLSYQYLINMLPAFSTVIDLENQCKSAAEPIGEETDIIFNHCLKLKNVAFSYRQDGSSFNLENLNLSVEAGKTTAIAGLSGAGKSTIADLVMGLLTPAKGSVIVDDVVLNHKNMLTWRKQIGYVVQDTFLFNDTIRNNLLFADPTASDENILEALKKASADEFILKLPDGLDAFIGDRGVLLSGGEKQRLALARAIVRKPSLLILDEATSNLDSENERNILDSLEDLHGNITILIIAHRLSTIRNADIIYLIQKGELVESGTWDELLKKVDGPFKALHEAQS